MMNRDFKNEFDKSLNMENKKKLVKEQEEEDEDLGDKDCVLPDSMYDYSEHSSEIFERCVQDLGEDIREEVISSDHSSLPETHPIYKHGNPNSNNCHSAHIHQSAPGDTNSKVMRRRSSANQMMLNLSRSNSNVSYGGGNVSGGGGGTVLKKVGTHSSMNSAGSGLSDSTLQEKVTFGDVDHGENGKRECCCETGMHEKSRSSSRGSPLLLQQRSNSMGAGGSSACIPSHLFCLERYVQSGLDSLTCDYAKSVEETEAQKTEDQAQDRLRSYTYGNSNHNKKQGSTEKSNRDTQGKPVMTNPTTISPVSEIDDSKVPTPLNRRVSFMSLLLSESLPPLSKSTSTTTSPSNSAVHTSSTNTTTKINPAKC